MKKIIHKFESFSKIDIKNLIFVFIPQHNHYLFILNIHSRMMLFFIRKNKKIYRKSQEPKYIPLIDIAQTTAISSYLILF